MTDSKPISVAQLIDTLSLGGAEHVAVNLANGLARLGYDSHLIASRREGAFSSYVAANVHVCCPERKWRWDLAGIKKIAAYLDANEIKLIHTHNHHSSYLMRIAFLVCKNKPLHVVHDHHGPALHSKKLSLYDWVMLRHVDAYIAVSEALRDRARKLLHLPKEYCLFLPNGIEVSEPHAFWDGRPTVIQVANLKWPKNHAMAMRVASMVRQHIPALNWICVGKIAEPSDDYIREVRGLIKSLNLSDCVTLLGESSNIRSILKRGNVGVLTSDSEGFPMTLLEYMAEQLPVVVTDVGQCPKIVREAGCGVVVPAGNAEKFAEKVVDLLSNPERAHKMGENGRVYVSRHFTVEEMTHQVHILYDKLLRKGHEGHCGRGTR